MAEVYWNRNLMFDWKYFVLFQTLSIIKKKTIIENYSFSKLSSWSVEAFARRLTQFLKQCNNLQRIMYMWIMSLFKCGEKKLLREKKIKSLV